jgi:hypothetical protein
MCEIFFAFQWWHQRKCLGMTAVFHKTVVPNLCAREHGKTISAVS